MVTFYHSYTKNEKYRIADMHQIHLMNSIAVIREGRHPMYTTRSKTYKALLAHVLMNAMVDAAVRGLCEGKKASTARREALEHLTAVSVLTVQKLRQYARELAGRNGVVAADSLRFHAEHRLGRPIDGSLIPNVFKTKDLVAIGHKKSTYPSARGREIRVYMPAGA